MGQPNSQPEVTLLVSYLTSLDEHKNTQWFWPNRLYPININVPSELEAWHHHVFTYLRERAGVTAHQARASEFKGQDLKAISIRWPTSGSLSTKLSLVYFRSELYAFISGESESQETDILTWVQAFDFAIQKTSEAHPEHRWWAVIGPTPALHSVTKTIGRAITIGNLDLREGNLAYEEDQHTSLRAIHVHSWIPVIVEGRSTGYNWEAASYKANEELYRLCALLSLETEQHWTRREHANAIESTPVVLPEPSLFSHRATPAREQELRERIAEVDEKHLINAWDNLHRNPCLERPLYAYYQGVGLSANFPSFAVVAFVAAIEETGKLLFATEKPKMCSECKRPLSNSAAQLFRQALELTMESDKTKRIADNLYRWRSGTGHSGALFGNETNFGDWILPQALFPLLPAHSFFAFGLYESQRAARTLLMKLLAGELSLRQT